MWKRILHKLRCIQCEGKLDLSTIEEHYASLSQKHIFLGEKMGIKEEELSHHIDTGILSCPKCKLWHPILHGLPVILPFITDYIHGFCGQHTREIKKLGDRYSLPNHPPLPDEKSVIRTFSREWIDYSSDDVIWTWTHKQREAIFLGEIGLNQSKTKPATFLEIGCGLGAVTSFAVKYLNSDAIGVDLSLSVGKAVQKYRDNPFLHFIQASLWKIPLEKKSFDMTYSHGVLHHTFSTQKAFREMVRFCKPGGMCYLWIYGEKSINANFSRRIAYALERILRPVLSRTPDILTTIVLTPVACSYMIISNFQKILGRKDIIYNFSRGLHAARDRFTPLFAHRTSLNEAVKWFEEEGFSDIREVSLFDLPLEAHETFRRNIGLRAVKI